MDVSLPVWTIRPNWKEGVLERLEWLTDVITSEVGVEQRRSVRQSPRRSFEITVNPTRGERTYLDLLMHRLGSNEWLFPLWHDQGVLTATAALGTQTLAMDTTFREFRDGDYALLYRSAFVWEVVQVSGITDASIGLSAKTAAAWPRGTKVFPLRRATVQADTSISALTTRTGQSVLLFQLNEANDFPEDTGDLPMYQGSPMILQEPNRSQEITTAHTRLAFERDGQIGLRYRVDDAGRAFAAQSHNWMIQGREAQAQFRSMLYYLRGQQRMVWLPTFNDDLTISRPIAQGGTRGDILKVGIGYVGGPIPGRARFWTGKEIVLHAAMVAPLSTDEERLAFTGPVLNAYPAGSTWSFVEPARLNSDTIEIQHHTDSDGVFEVSTAFKTFANDRVAGMPIYLPTPQGTKNNVLCGEPPDADKNPCYFAPSDIAYQVSCSSGNPCNPNHDGNITISHPAYRPNPGGRLIGGFGGTTGEIHAPYPRTLTFYESFVEGNPFLQGQKLAELILTDFNTWVCNFYYEPPLGAWRANVFPSARYCGTVGKDSGTLSVSAGRPGGGAEFSGTVSAGGISNSTWDWVR